MEAQFSFPYAVSAALVDGQAFIPQFAPERLNDTQINTLAKKVKVKTDDKFTSIYPKQWASGVAVKTKDRKFYTEVIGAKGDPINPLSNEEIIEKFRSLSSVRFSEEKQNRMIEALKNVENADTITFITELIRG